MSGVVLVLPEPPSANRYWRVWQNRVVRSPEAEVYIGQVMVAVRTMRRVERVPAGIPVAVTIRWHRAKKMGDLDNRIKVTLDALCGLLYDDDKQVEQIHAYRAESPRDGRLEVTVTRLDSV